MSEFTNPVTVTMNNIASDLYLTLGCKIKYKENYYNSSITLLTIHVFEIRQILLKRYWQFGQFLEFS